MSDKRIVLASGSPRRKELLSQLGVTFDVVVSNLDEYIDPNLSPYKVAESLALLKAREVSKLCDKNTLIIGADTIIFFEDNILGKPEDKEHAKAMLRSLGGKEHSVITGLAFIDKEKQEEKVMHVEAKVTMRDYLLQDIDDYIETGEPMDKAAGYAIQGLGRKLIKKYEGCYTGIVGLPICRLKEELQKSGIQISANTPECTLDSGQKCPNLEF